MTKRNPDVQNRLKKEKNAVNFEYYRIFTASPDIPV